jgi:uracil-DNA glycosylase
MNWKDILAPVLATPKFKEVSQFLKKERETKNIYPAGTDVFRAFDLCPFDRTDIVILGQDPYHTPGTADGLAFSTKQDKRPLSLEVIFKEIYTDLNIQYRKNITLDEYFPTNNLEKWAMNGFLLLNTSLTVEEGKPGSHKDLGWKDVIIAAINGILKRERPVIFLFWGKEAKEFESLINPKSKHMFFSAAHPATELYPDSKGGFYHCRHFSLIRDIIPMINGVNLFKSLYLDSCFDKEKAKELVKEHYPIGSERICEYIDKELFINVPVNKDAYWNEISKFEDIISTKY